MADLHKDKWWLEDLADAISDHVRLVELDGVAGGVIPIEDLQDILQYYFPQFKLTDYDRTSTDAGDNTPQLASNITTPIRQPEDEDTTGADATELQVVSL